MTSGTLMQACRRPLGPAAAVILLLCLGINLLMLASPVFMLQVFDRVVPTANTDTLAVLVVMAVGALAVLGLLDEVRTRLLVRVGAWWEKAVSPLVLAGAVRLAAERGGSGAQPLRDVATVRQFVGGPAIVPLLDAPWVPVFVLVVYLVHPWLGHVALAGAFLLFALALANERLTSKRQGKANNATAEATGFAEAAIRNSDAILSMSMLPALIRRWQQSVNGAIDASSRTAALSGALTASSKALRLGLQVAVLAVGAMLVLSQEITAGGMIAASIIMSRALAPVEQALTSWRSFVAARIAYARLAQALERTDALEDKVSLPAPEGRLSAEGVTYVPPGARKPVVANLALAVPAGGSIGIIGPSGSGKSTVARLLVGAILPAAGTVRLDGADLADWPADERGRHIGYLPQDVQLFDATVGENISRLGASADEAIVAAAEAAGAHEIIVSLPGGYNAPVRDNGRTLSGGQRQRIGLARAFFGNPRVLVLDEPTASLDGDGEREVIAAITAAKARAATVVLIDHKMKMMRLVDHLLVMQEGRVSKFGPRDEVLRELQAAAAPKRPAGPHQPARAPRPSAGTGQVTRAVGSNDG